MDLSTPQGLLAALLFPVYIVMWVATHILNTSDWWVQLASKQQQVYLFGASVILAIGSYAALHLIPGTVFSNEVFQQLYSIIYALVVALIGGQFGQITGLRAHVERTRLLAEHHSLLSGGDG